MLAFQEFNYDVFESSSNRIPKNLQNKKKLLYIGIHSTYLVIK